MPWGKKEKKEKKAKERARSPAKEKPRPRSPANHDLSRVWSPAHDDGKSPTAPAATWSSGPGLQPELSTAGQPVPEPPEANSYIDLVDLSDHYPVAGRMTFAVDEPADSAPATGGAAVASRWRSLGLTSSLATAIGSGLAAAARAAASCDDSRASAARAVHTLLTTSANAFT